MNVHNPSNQWVDPHKRINNGPFTQIHTDDIAQINHYFSKTQEEFQLKCDRGRADTPNIRRTMSEFNGQHCNQIEDLFAYNFLHS